MRGTRKLRYALAALAAVLSVPASVWLAARLLPLPERALACRPPSVVIADSEGRPLRVWLGADDLDYRPGYKPDPGHWITHAMVSAEDRRFWSHHGLDPLAVVRALAQNTRARRRISGASTLSTQVIRLLEPRPRTLRTKFIEAFRALQLEQRHDKTDILALYLDLAPFGGNIVGIEAAARRYFGKPPAELSLGEAALLAGLPQSPSRYRPDRHPCRAAIRQSYVLGRMQADGIITEEQAALARAQSMDVRPPVYPFRAPHFCDWIGVPHADDPTRPVRTTLDADMQRLAEETLRRHLGGHHVQGGAVVVLEVETGAVLALVGSPDYQSPQAGQVNAARAPRAAGSTLKPFLYALALDRGWMTPRMLLADQPIHYRDYDPRNFDETFRGSVTFHDALVLSLNVPALHVQRRVGQPLFYNTLHRLGLSSLSRPAEHYGTGLVLGNGEVRLLDLANAYASLARGGQFLPLRTRHEEPPRLPQNIFSPEAAWLISEILGGEERARDTTGHHADVRLPPMAWKTGTSTGRRDAWTVAWNPEYVIGVWVGNPDGTRDEVLVGRQAATPIAWDVFRSLYPDNLGPWFARPEDVRKRHVCAVSGCAPGPHCGHLVTDWHILRVSRNTPCPVHRSAPGAAGREFLAGMHGRVPSSRAPAPNPVRITSPAHGSAYRYLPALSSDVQRIPLVASSDESEGLLYWYVNDRPHGTTRPGESIFWPLQPGQHRIVCSTSGGRHALVKILVE